MLIATRISATSLTTMLASINFQPAGRSLIWILRSTMRAAQISATSPPHLVISVWEHLSAQIVSVKTVSHQKGGTPQRWKTHTVFRVTGIKLRTVAGKNIDNRLSLFITASNQSRRGGNRRSSGENAEEGNSGRKDAEGLHFENRVDRVVSWWEDWAEKLIEKLYEELSVRSGMENWLMGGGRSILYREEFCIWILSARSVQCSARVLRSVWHGVFRYVTRCIYQRSLTPSSHINAGPNVPKLNLKNSIPCGMTEVQALSYSRRFGGISNESA